MKKAKYIDPRVDFAFKKIFGSEDTKDILISFLNNLLDLKGDKLIKSVSILDPYQLPQIKALKTSILDVKCTDHKDISYIVEMQVRNVKGMLKRIQYNAAKRYVSQIETGKDYPNLNQVIAITITDYHMFDKKIIPHYVSCHITMEKETKENLLEDIVYYFIELPKFNKDNDSLDNILDKWIYFLKMTGELRDIPNSLNEEPFVHAFEKAQIINMDEDEYEYYEKAQMAITDEEGAILFALNEGMEKGIEKGKNEVAKNLLKQNKLSIDEISIVSGLSVRDIQDLSSSL